MSADGRKTQLEHRRQLLWSGTAGTLMSSMELPSVGSRRRLRHLVDATAAQLMRPSTRHTADESAAATLRVKGASAALTAADLMLGCAFNKPNEDGSLRLVGRSDAIATVATALRLGVKAIDTAPLYGAGRSEEYIGDALVSAGLGATAGLRIWSKAGVVIRRSEQLSMSDPPLPLSYEGTRALIRDYSRPMARRCLVESLVRLRVPALTGLRIHGPNRSDRVNVEGQGVREKMTVSGVEQSLSDDGMLRGLTDLREAGEIEEASLGLQCHDAASVASMLPLMLRPQPGTVQSALVAGGYNLLNQEALPMFIEAERLGIEIHNAGVFSSGLLAGGVTVYASSGSKPTKELQALASGWAKVRHMY